MGSMATVVNREALDSLHAGVVLTCSDVEFPESLKVQPEPLMSRWGVLSQVKASGLDQDLRNFGWQLFCIPPEVRSGALGFSRNGAIARSLQKLLARTESEHFNACTDVSSRRFLGVWRGFLGVWRAVLSAQVRHVQEGIILLQPVAKQKGNRLQRAA